MLDFTETTSMETGDPPSQPSSAAKNSTATGLQKLLTLPAYHEYRRYLPAMNFYKDLVRVNALIDRIYTMESAHFGACYINTPNGRHFNTCSWAQCTNGEACDVVDTCACMLIGCMTEQCIELLYAMGLNKTNV